MPLIVTEPAKRVTLITIDAQEKMNAMSRQMMSELCDIWDRLEADPGCRAVVLTGAGERAFCAGADLSGDLEATEELSRIVNKSLLKLTPFSKPIVAAVNGVCAGGGIEYLIATDIRYASETARFGLPEVKWGVYPFGGAATKLVRQISYVHTMDMIPTGRLMPAAEAKEINLINQVLPPNQVLDKALETATLIAKNSPTAVQAVREQISSMMTSDAALHEERDQMLGDRVRSGADFQEGIAAFNEKRPPNYG
jgi:enoyl-CoA hydratase/carnithine racemase